jgi:hypothetical protein
MQTNCGHEGMKMLRYRKVMSSYLPIFTYDIYYIFQSRVSTYSTQYIKSAYAYLPAQIGIVSELYLTSPNYL